MQLFFVHDDYIVTLPVNPESLKVSYQTDNQSENVVGIGNINMLRDRQLMDIEVSSFFAAHAEYPFVLTKGVFQEPQFYIDYFNNIVTKKEPLRFIVTETEINLLVGIQSFEYSYKHGTSDVDFTLQLKEYRPFGVKEMRPVDQTDSGEAVYETDEVTRDPEGFAIGDRVFVTGAVLDNPFGNDDEGRLIKLAAGEEATLNYIWEGESPYMVRTETWVGWVREHQIWHSK